MEFKYTLNFTFAYAGKEMGNFHENLEFLDSTLNNSIYKNFSLNIIFPREEALTNDEREAIDNILKNHKRKPLFNTLEFKAA